MTKPRFILNPKNFDEITNLDEKKADYYHLKIRKNNFIWLTGKENDAFGLGLDLGRSVNSNFQKGKDFSEGNVPPEETRAFLKESLQINEVTAQQIEDFWDQKLTYIILSDIQTKYGDKQKKFFTEFYANLSNKKGTIFLDVYNFNFKEKEFIEGEIQETPVPGIAHYRFQLTEKGFKFLHEEFSNELLQNLTLKYDTEITDEAIKKAQQDEENYFLETINSLKNPKLQYLSKSIYEETQKLTDEFEKANVQTHVRFLLEHQKDDSFFKIYLKMVDKLKENRRITNFPGNDNLITYLDGLAFAWCEINKKFSNDNEFLGVKESDRDLVNQKILMTYIKKASPEELRVLSPTLANEIDLDKKDPVQNIFLKSSRLQKIDEELKTSQHPLINSFKTNFSIYQPPTLLDQLKLGVRYVFTRDQDRPLWKEFLGLPRFDGPRGLDIFKGIAYGLGGFILIPAKNMVFKGLEIALISGEILTQRGINALIDKSPTIKNPALAFLTVQSLALLGIGHYLLKGVRVAVRTVTSPIRSAEEGWRTWKPLGVLSGAISFGAYVVAGILAAPVVLPQVAAYLPQTAGLIATGVAKLASLLSLPSITLGPLSLSSFSFAAGVITAAGVAVATAVRGAVNKLSNKPTSVSVKRKVSDVSKTEKITGPTVKINDLLSKFPPNGNSKQEQPQSKPQLKDGPLKMEEEENLGTKEEKPVSPTAPWRMKYYDKIGIFADNKSSANKQSAEPGTSPKKYRT